jgi:hypothetical protein
MGARGPTSLAGLLLGEKLAGGGLSVALRMSAIARDALSLGFVAAAAPTAATSKRARPAASSEILLRT